MLKKFLKLITIIYLLSILWGCTNIEDIQDFKSSSSSITTSTSSSTSSLAYQDIYLFGNFTDWEHVKMSNHNNGEYSFKTNIGPKNLEFKFDDTSKLEGIVFGEGGWNTTNNFLKTNLSVYSEITFIFNLLSSNYTVIISPISDSSSSEISVTSSSSIFSSSTSSLPTSSSVSESSSSIFSSSSSISTPGSSSEISSSITVSSSSISSSSSSISTPGSSSEVSSSVSESSSSSSSSVPSVLPGTLMIIFRNWNESKTLYLPGDWNGWNPSGDNINYTAGTEKTNIYTNAIISENISKGDNANAIEFKVLNTAGDWNSAWWFNEWTKNNVLLTKSGDNAQIGVTCSPGQIVKIIFDVGTSTVTGIAEDPQSQSSSSSSISSSSSSSLSSSSSSSSASGTNQVIVHFKKPSSWPGAYIHYWGEGITSPPWWDSPAMTPEGNDWYVYTINAPIASFLFKNTSGSNNVTQTADIVNKSGEGWYWTNNQWYTSNPEDTSKPIVTIILPSYDYTITGAETFTLYGTFLGNISGIYVSVNGGTEVNASISGNYWSNTISLNLGTNIFYVYAAGTSGQNSITNTMRIVRIVSSLTNHNGTTYSGKLGANLYANGTEFSVHWRSSVVSAVKTKIGDTLYPMTKITDPRGDIWWCFIPGIGAGTEYQFVGTKSGGDVTIADPYSKYNRYSGGKSVVVDQTLFQWTDQAWQRPGWEYYIVYEIHIKDFTSADPSVPLNHRGKYLGVIDKIPYLTNLGITAIHIMPPSEFPDAGYSWGYNTSLYMAVESGYATEPLVGQKGVDEFKQMVNELHRAGIAVIVDLVFNHTASSDNHLWVMDEVLYFDYNNNGVVEAQPGGPDSTPWGNRLCTWRDEVKRLGKDTIEYFMKELHVDGFRFDATHTDFMDHSFLRELKTFASSIDPNVYFVYENLPNQADLKGWGAQWADGYHDAGVNLYRGGQIKDFTSRIYYNKDDGWANSPVEALNYFESHDEDTLGFHAFDPTHGVGYDVGTAKARSRMAAVLLAGSLGNPMIWMGQEFLRNREGQNINEIPLDWNTYNNNQDLYQYYGAVFRLRRDNPALRSNDETKFAWQYAPWNGDPNVCAWSRTSSNPSEKKFVIVVNSDRWSSKTVTIGFPENGTWTKVITEGGWNGTETINVTSGSYQITIGANSGIIFMK